MKRLERDKTVIKWTKNHGITIQYVTEAGNIRGYRLSLIHISEPTRLQLISYAVFCQKISGNVSNAVF